MLNIKIDFGVIILLILCIIILFYPNISNVYKYISFAGIIYLGAKGRE